MTIDTTETHPAATAYQIEQVLGLTYPLGTHRDGTICLSNAEARRLLALAIKGLQS